MTRLKLLIPTKMLKVFVRLRHLFYERFPNDPALVEMARIVQAADFNDQLDNHPAACGLQLISRGFPLVTNSDNETAERAAFVYDALYASIKQSQTKP